MCQRRIGEEHNEWLKGSELGAYRHSWKVCQKKKILAGTQRKVLKVGSKKWFSLHWISLPAVQGIKASIKDSVRSISTDRQIEKKMSFLSIFWYATEVQANRWVYRLAYVYINFYLQYVETPSEGYTSKILKRLL